MRRATQAVSLLLDDLRGLFSRDAAKSWFLLLSALILQAGFWYSATPGPSLLRFAPKGPLTAAAAVLWSAVFFLLVPSVIYRWAVGDLPSAGFRRGDQRFGLAAALGLGVLAVPAVILVSTNSSLAAAYPWPGAWVGEAGGRLLLWVAAYALYFLSFEAFYRGFILSAAEQLLGGTRALWLQAIMATLIHLGRPLGELLVAAPASLLLGALALRSRSIYYPALLHLMVGVTLDVAILVRSGLLNW